MEVSENRPAGFPLEDGRGGSNGFPLEGDDGRGCSKVMLPRIHPLLRLAFVPLVARTLGLCCYYFGHDLAGHPAVLAPAASLARVLPFHLAVLSGLPVLLLGAWNLWPRLRPLVAFSLAAEAIAVVPLGQCDLLMRRFLGQGLTMSSIRVYTEPSTLDASVTLPLLHDWLFVSGSLLLIGVALVASLYLCYQAAYQEPQRPVRRAATILLLALITPLGLRPIREALYGSPPELSILRSLLGQELSRPADEGKATADLRAYVNPPAGSVWLDDKRPLLRQEPAGLPAVSNPPDIILVIVESLRGRDVGFASGRSPSPTPNLDRMAAAGVALPHYLSNAFPSAPALMALHTSSWPHRYRHVAHEFPDLKLDAFPRRLEGLGYDTRMLFGLPPEFDNLDRWARSWYRSVIFDLPANDLGYTGRVGDCQIFDQVIAQLDKHDREKPNTPLMLSVFTAGTHQPFTLETPGPFDTRGIVDPQLRYDRVLSNLDTQIGRLDLALQTRPRKDNTVLFVVGDHSQFTAEQLPEDVRSLPVDSTNWTGALIAGPRRLLGPARRVEEVRSHLDLMPTILRLAGDRGPTVVLGSDLLQPAAQPTTMSVRLSGVRLDCDGMAVLFWHGRPDRPWVFRPFQPEQSFSRSLGGSPCSPDDLKAADERARYFSYLIEQNRVAP